MSNRNSDKLKYYQTGDYWLLTNGMAKSSSMKLFQTEISPRIRLKKDINIENLITKYSLKKETNGFNMYKNKTFKRLESNKLPKIVAKPVKENKIAMHPERMNMYKIFNNAFIRDGLCKKKLRISQFMLPLNL
jgi:hypothetical protein